MTILRRLATCERGYTLIELVQVAAILSVVLTGLTVLFVQATNAEFQMNERFQAQQSARLAVDKMRRELHCASAITPTGSAASITVTLPAQCPTSGGSQVNIVYDTALVSANRYRLRRAGVMVADYVTTGTVFDYTAPADREARERSASCCPSTRAPAKKHVWRLVADIVLRNTTRL